MRVKYQGFLVFIIQNSRELGKNQMKLNFFKERLPSNADMFTVLGVVVFIVHSWSVRGFLFKLPSFMLYLSVWDILSVFSYMMAFALLEAMLVMS